MMPLFVASFLGTQLSLLVLKMTPSVLLVQLAVGLQTPHLARMAWLAEATPTWQVIISRNERAKLIAITNVLIRFADSLRRGVVTTELWRVACQRWSVPTLLRRWEDTAQEGCPALRKCSEEAAMKCVGDFRRRWDFKQKWKGNIVAQ